MLPTNPTLSPPPHAPQAIAEVCAVCNEANIEVREGRFKAVGNPTEAALLVLAEKLGVPDAQLQAQIQETRRALVETHGDDVDGDDEDGYVWGGVCVGGYVCVMVRVVMMRMGVCGVVGGGGPLHTPLQAHTTTSTHHYKHAPLQAHTTLHTITCAHPILPTPLYTLCTAP